MLTILLPAAVVALAVVAFRVAIWWNVTRTLRHTRKLAAQGDADGLNGMGIYYQQKGNDTQAAEHFHRAARLNHSEAKGHLGGCYLHGRGVEQNTTRALELLRESAAAGSEVGQTLLGMCYMEGNGVEADAQEAARLFGLAAAQDDEEAQYLLGMCYLQGTGVEPDRDRAIELLRSAAYNLQPEAAQKLDELGIHYITILDEDEKETDTPPTR